MLSVVVPSSFPLAPRAAAGFGWWDLCCSSSLGYDSGHHCVLGTTAPSHTPRGNAACSPSCKNGENRERRDAVSLKLCFGNAAS